MTPEELSTLLHSCVHAAVTVGQLALDPGEVPPVVAVERPKNSDHGDWATNIALQLAKSAGLPPRQVAETLLPYLQDSAGIARAEVAGPGFINITLTAASQGALAREIVMAGKQFGTGNTLVGQRINVEFISANPTGPLHLGHTRWAAVGDSLARVLAAHGAEVTREFYINDRGVQMDKFGASAMAVARGEAVPADGYHGAYVPILAKQIVAQQPGIMRRWQRRSTQLAAFREAAYRLQLADQERVLDLFNTHFDVWYSERSLHESGAVERGFARLREQGHMYEQDGAVWLRTTDFDDDKDRVLVKADGELTYFASDTAYYVDKRYRGFDLCIYLLGADHHGYVLDLDLLVQRSNDNPVYYVQYAHARIASVLRNAAAMGLVPDDTTEWATVAFDPALLQDEREGQLLGLLADYPRPATSRR